MFPLSLFLENLGTRPISWQTAVVLGSEDVFLGIAHRATPLLVKSRDSLIILQRNSYTSRCTVYAFLVIGTNVTLQGSLHSWHIFAANADANILPFSSVWLHAVSLEILEDGGRHCRYELHAYASRFLAAVSSNWREINHTEQGMNHGRERQSAAPEPRTAS
jgi:hypothetical protein